MQKMLLDECHLLFEEYLQGNIILQYPKSFLRKRKLFEEGIQQDKDRAKLKMFEWTIKRLLEFGIRMIWRIMQIEEGVIHRGLIQWL